MGDSLMEALSEVDGIGEPPPEAGKDVAGGCTCRKAAAAAAMATESPILFSSSLLMTKLEEERTNECAKAATAVATATESSTLFSSSLLMTKDEKRTNECWRKNTSKKIKLGRFLVRVET